MMKENKPAVLLLIQSNMREGVRFEILDLESNRRY